MHALSLPSVWAYECFVLEVVPGRDGSVGGSRRLGGGLEEERTAWVGKGRRWQESNTVAVSKSRALGGGCGLDFQADKICPKQGSASVDDSFREKGRAVVILSGGYVFVGVY